MRITPFALALAAVVLVGCSGDGDTDADAAAEPAAEATTDVVTPAAVRELDSGVQIHVGGPTFDGELVRIPVEAFNGYHDVVELANSEPDLADNDDNRYEYRPPETNQELLVESGDIIRGEFVFEIVDDGRGDESDPAPSPTRFHLDINPWGSNHAAGEFHDLAVAD